MNVFSQTNRYAADKIVFLGFLILALFGAWLITTSRSSLSLGEPINLNYSNLSVAMPIGRGWQSEQAWQFKKTAHTLSSIFAPAEGRPAMLVHCKYLIDFSGADHTAFFEKKALSVGGSILSTGQIPVEGLVVEWANIKRSGAAQMEMLFGTVLLPYNRRVDIEVHYGTADFDFGDKVFKTICENIKFSKNQLLIAGSEIIAQVKSAGVGQLLAQREPSTFFLIKDSAAKPLGFTMDVMKGPAENSQFNIQMMSYYYIKGKYPAEHVGLFQCVDNFEEFYWKSELSTVAGASGYEITQKSSAPAIVRIFGRLPKEASYHLGPTVVADTLLELVAGQMVRSGYKEIMVDILESDGNTTIAVFSEVPGDSVETPRGTVLELRLLNKSGGVQQVYLDENYQVYKQILPDQGVTFERTSQDVIIKNFPERLEYIQQKNKVGQGNQI